MTLVVLPNDLIAEILSFLPVISLVRFTCVSKSWKTLISDLSFVKLHFNRSSSTLNPPCTLISHYSSFQIHTITYTATGNPSVTCYNKDEFAVVPCSMQRLIENPSIDPYYLFKDKEYNECSRMADTCNGLVLLLTTADSFSHKCLEYWFRLSNPATRTTSPKFGHLQGFRLEICSSFNFKLGYDNSTNTYKVVAYCYNPSKMRSIVRILTVGNNVWRDIKSFPVVPLNIQWDHNCFWHNGVYFSDTLNWLAIHNHNDINYNIKNLRVEQFVIVSLDLGTETYNQYLLPLGFDEVPPAEPKVGVLGGYLCFSYSSYKETEFVLWQMKKFGIEESWSQLLKISFQNLRIHYDAKHNFELTPLLLFGDHILILNGIQERHPLLYNWRENRVERIQTTASTTFTDNRPGCDICWYPPNCYIESLVSPI